MRPHSRARQLVPLMLACVLITMMASRGRLENIRTVDALSLFAAGLASGVALTNLLRRQ